MRFIILGVGAIGGVLAGSLSRGGHEVVAIARGKQLEVITERGLRVNTPHWVADIELQVAPSPAEISYRTDDVALITVKSQDTAAAAAELHRYAGPGVSVVCMQNGVANEGFALRFFSDVYGGVVMMPATFVEAGEVSVYGDPYLGTIDVGRYPSGVDARAEAMASALRSSGFDSRAVPDIMRWKYGKLVGNLTNSIEAICGLGTRGGELGRLVTAEGERVLSAAGIDYASEEDEDERRAGNIEHDQVGGVPRRGASSWQSLARGSGSIETSYLNGEIALLGRLHDVPTPANALVQEVASRLAVTGAEPGSTPEDDLLARLVDARDGTQEPAP